MLRESILKMQEKLQQEVPYLNNGGCIWFAVYFTKVLKEKGIPYKVYSCNWNHGSGRTYDDFQGASHIVLFTNDLGYFDGHKIIKKLNYRYIKHLKLKNLNKLAEKDDCWNDEYDISDNYKLNKIIKEFIL